MPNSRPLVQFYPVDFGVVVLVLLVLLLVLVTGGKQSQLLVSLGLRC